MIWRRGARLELASRGSHRTVPIVSISCGFARGGRSCPASFQRAPFRPYAERASGNVFDGRARPPLVIAWVTRGSACPRSKQTSDYTVYRSSSSSKISLVCCYKDAEIRFLPITERLHTSNDGINYRRNFLDSNLGSFVRSLANDTETPSIDLGFDFEF